MRASWLPVKLAAGFACALVLSPSLAAATHSYERLPTWTHVPSACAVDEAALTKYSFSNGEFTFKGTEISSVGPPPFFLVEPIVVRCNVVSPYEGSGEAGDDEEFRPQWDRLVVGYRDPDGTATDHHVVARLRRIARATGAASTIATFDSNALSTTAKGEGYVEFSHSWDFMKGGYFVEIQLVRRNTSANPRAFAVRLERSIEVPH